MVRVHIILVAPFTDVQYAVVVAVDIDDGGLPRLPVQVGMLGHGTLYDGIPHIQVVEVVAGIPEHERLIVGHARALIREELMLEPFRAKSLVGVDCHRFLGGAARGPSSDPCLAQLVQAAWCVPLREVLDVDRSPPVLPVLAGVVGEDADIRAVQVPAVGDYRDHR